MRPAGLRRFLAGALALAVLAAPGAASAAEHVIHISIDGLSSPLLQALIAADTAGDFASFERFLDEGASTWNARTDATHSITLPNHTSMLNGRPVLQPVGQPNTVHHGWTTNVDPLPGVTLHNGGTPISPTSPAPSTWGTRAVGAAWPGPTRCAASTTGSRRSSR